MMKDVEYKKLDELKVHQQNNKYFDDIKGPEYEIFKKSIMKEGIITPLIVSADMTILSGHQRYKAASELKFSEVPVIVKKDIITEEDKLKKLLASNFGRLKNNPIKKSRIIVQYEKLYGVQRGNPNLLETTPLKTQHQIAEELGISIDTLKRLKNLQKLSPSVQKKVEEGELSYNTALKVFGTLEYEDQKEVIEKFTGLNLKKITAPTLKKMISEGDFRFSSLYEKCNSENLNRKLRAICTHMIKETSTSISSIKKIKEKCDKDITERNREYLETTVNTLKKMLEDLNL